jgi:hypothetical protein
LRAAGSVIWATDLVESSEASGGKGQPSVTSYSYSVSLAVAAASRPIERLGRIWADGNLLRGAAGDLKVGGELRVYLGHGDQAPDPLILADRGGACPAFRGLAYCVFEGLQLADFGNRIPALTFEVVADDGEVSLAEVLAPLDEPLELGRPLPGLAGFSDEGGALAASLGVIDQLYPISLDAGGCALSITTGGQAPVEPALLPAPAVDPADESFGGGAGKTGHRQAGATDAPAAVRYYDPARDYQASLQRAPGRARPGRDATIEFAGVLDAGTAQTLLGAAAGRANWARETLSWRMSEIDPAVGPGKVVRVPEHPGLWQIDSWEWRDSGVEFELRRLPPTTAPVAVGDAGEALAKPDLLATPTQLVAFELPWDGQGGGGTRQAFAAVSSASSGWRGAALYVDQAGGLVPLGPSGSRRSLIGALASALPASPAMLFEPCASLEVELVASDLQLADAMLEDLAQGANRAVVGEEVIQFAQATHVGGGRWQLQGLLRGRGGTESFAQAGHPTGTPFALLDGAPVALDPNVLGREGEATIAAIGLADAEPVVSALIGARATTRPLAPVHPGRGLAADGTVTLSWARRARGAWAWPDLVETPLNEQSERYLVGVGDVDNPSVRWELTEPRLDLGPSTYADLAAAHPGAAVWVRQLGDHAASPALRLTTL